VTFCDDPDSELEIDLTPPPVGTQYHPAETEEILYTLRELIENARDVPLSASSMIIKDEVLTHIDNALGTLPEELRAAKWLLKESEEILTKARHEGAELVKEAQDRAEYMVQRTEVVKAAEQRAYDIVDSAQVDARRLRHEVEDFCDQKLASFEIVLERTQKLVGAGRAKLQGTNLLANAAAAAAQGTDGTDETVGNVDSFGASVASPDEFAALADLPSPGVYNELSGLDNEPALYEDEYDDDFGDDDEEDLAWDDGALPFGQSRPRLTVVDDRYVDLPAPPASGRDPGGNFFDQDLA